MELIDKSAVVAEITNLKVEYVCGWNYTINKVLEHIDDLEVKEVDLEKEIDDWYNTMGIPVTADAMKETARHFFELGLKVLKGE